MRAADSIYSPDFAPWPAKRSVLEGAVCHLAPCSDNNHHLGKFLKFRLTWENAGSWPWAFTVPAAKQLANDTISKSELNPHPYTCTLCTGQCIKKLDHHYCKCCSKKKKRFWVVSISNPQLSFNTLLSLSSSSVGHHSSKNISFSWRQKLWSVQHVMTICCQLCKFQCPLAFQQHETSPSVDPISLGNVCSSIWNKQPWKFGIFTIAKNHKW